MAALGNIGVKGFQTKVSPDLTPVARQMGLSQIVCGTDVYALGGKDAGTGSPAPAMRLDGNYRFRFRWRVASGTRTVQCQVMQAANASPRPTIIVRANPSVGVNADVVATAGAGTGWVTAGPVTITPSSNGAVWVEIWNNLRWQAGGAPLFIDNITVT